MTKVKDLEGWDWVKSRPQPTRAILKFLIFLIVMIAWVIQPFVLAVRYLRKKLC